MIFRNSMHFAFRFCFFARTQVQWRLMLAGLLALLLSPAVKAQSQPSTLSEVVDKYKIKASVGLQLWSTYGYGMEVINEDGQAIPAEARFNAQLRRSRFSLKGNPYSTLSFKVTAALDLVGHDVLSSTEAGGNNGSSPIFRIWNAFVQWQAKPKNDRLYLVGGYFVSPIGRESNVAALASTSFEKAWSQNYLRRHLTGIGPGRAMGLMVAGQLHGEGNQRHLTYELALQNPLFTGLAGNSSGLASSPLLTTRFAFQLGDPEQKSYKPGKKVNYFGQRKGITLGLAAARQGSTDLFKHNTAYGLDWLANTNNWHLDGELYHLKRSGRESDNRELETAGYSGYLRLGHNIALPRSLSLEPVVSYWFYRGATDLSGIESANQLGAFSGADSGLDIGANLYFNPTTKLSLFFALRRGDSGEGSPELVNNNYFRQPGVGLVERGSYVGLGWVGVF
ncbi:hypothetical protein [Neolewinella agarilytica]|nr:hypothetical protein [Neolewinella agarilytica]